MTPNEPAEVVIGTSLTVGPCPRCGVEKDLNRDPVFENASSADETAAPKESIFADHPDWAWVCFGCGLAIRTERSGLPPG